LSENYRLKYEYYDPWIQRDRQKREKEEISGLRKSEVRNKLICGIYREVRYKLTLKMWEYFFGSTPAVRVYVSDFSFNPCFGSGFSMLVQGFISATASTTFISYCYCCHLNRNWNASERPLESYHGNNVSGLQQHRVWAMMLSLVFYCFPCYAWFLCFVFLILLQVCTLYVCWIVWKGL
jgi:hypothetical protein